MEDPQCLDLESGLTRALALVDAIVLDSEAWARSPEANAPCGDDEEDARDLAMHIADYRAKFGAELEAVGIARYLAAVFVRSDTTRHARNQESSTSFFWEPGITLADVIAITRLIAHDPYAAYHFAWFAWRELGIDVRELAKNTDVPEPIRSELGKFEGSVYIVDEGAFHGSGDRAFTDETALQKRLREEGAPMLRR